MRARAASVATVLPLPESPHYLALRGAAPERIGAVLARMVPAAKIGEDARFVAPVRPAGSPVGQLFRDGLGACTLLIWTTFFMSLLVFNLLAS
jgi:AAHS family 4-hydroxybenzoate transporter-like MFS transporter